MEESVELRINADLNGEQVKRLTTSACAVSGVRSGCVATATNEGKDALVMRRVKCCEGVENNERKKMVHSTRLTFVVWGNEKGDAEAKNERVKRIAEQVSDEQSITCRMLYEQHRSESEARSSTTPLYRGNAQIKNVLNMCY